jgi:hypothetical protein
MLRRYTDAHNVRLRKLIFAGANLRTAFYISTSTNIVLEDVLFEVYHLFLLTVCNQRS